MESMSIHDALIYGIGFQKPLFINTPIKKIHACWLIIIGKVDYVSYSINVKDMYKKELNDE